MPFAVTINTVFGFGDCANVGQAVGEEGLDSTAHHRHEMSQFIVNFGDVA